MLYVVIDVYCSSMRYRQSETLKIDCSVDGIGCLVVVVCLCVLKDETTARPVFYKETGESHISFGLTETYRNVAMPATHRTVPGVADALLAKNQCAGARKASTKPASQCAAAKSQRQECEGGSSKAVITRLG